MNNPHPTTDPADDERRLALSALADGQADASAAQASCERWHDDAALRERWHAYHLIGDVLRSDELASPPGRDAAFLAGVRARLAGEPVVLAPQPRLVAPGAAAHRLQRWLTPAAVAAGFMAVAGALLVSRQDVPGERGAVLAGASAPTEGLARVGVGSGAASAPPALLVDGQLIRDAQLDAYLRAHRDARGSSATAVPGGALRSVETIVPNR